MIAHNDDKLILVRHAHPKVVPTWQPALWTLSDSGRASCHRLARLLGDFYPDVVVSSREVKAIETGQILAGDLGKPFKVAEGLHEHERPNVGWFDSVAQFEAEVANFFHNPRQVVFGTESADDAHRRFSAALQRVIDQHPGDNLAVVTHGTVMSLLLSRLIGADGFAFWRTLEMPAYAILALPSLTVLEICANIEDIAIDS